MKKDDGYTRYTVRIPTPLYERIKDAAGEKSVNAEIVQALEAVFPPPSDLHDELMMLFDSLSDENKEHVLSLTQEMVKNNIANSNTDKD